MDFNLTFPSRITVTAFETLSGSCGPSALDLGLDFDSTDPEPPNLAFADRSSLSPNVVRYLLGRYGDCFAPRYSLLEPELLSNDGVSFKKLADISKSKILLACATAAAREAYRSPTWKALAQVCRDWAGELIRPIIATGNKDALTMTIMLLTFELAEPSRGLVWDLLSFATRMCLQLGWLQESRAAQMTSPVLAIEGDQEAVQAASEQQALVAMLRDIDRCSTRAFPDLNRRC